MSYAGLTQDPDLENYSIILDYAQDNLRGYLQSTKLGWAEKLRLAKELTSGLYCIHSYEMYHGSLVNILKIKFINLSIYFFIFFPVSNACVF